MGYKADVILDSLHPDGTTRLTTLEVTFPRFVLAEFNTHRAFSRNSASSRAIPVKTMIDMVREDPVIPLVFPTEQKGMQGGEPLTGVAYERAVADWLQARNVAVTYAKSLSTTHSVHKSIVNRLLEPFLWHTVIVSATEWVNFFELRANPLAQPEIRQVAEMMMEALWASEPQPLGYGEWHLPYVTGYDYFTIMSMHKYTDDTKTTVERLPDFAGNLETAKLCSAARCARVSYLTHDTGQVDITKDIALATRLMDPGEGPMHASPFEHVATPGPTNSMAGHTRGNFEHWVQFRHELEDARELAIA